MQDDRFPAIEPYDGGMLDVGNGHQVYWECCANPAGKPALYQSSAFSRQLPAHGASGHSRHESFGRAQHRY
jgi:hypothetical protein